MTQQMLKSLDSFFADRTIDDIDSDTFLIHNLIDTTNKLTISLVFLRDWHSLETGSYNYVPLKNKGAVFTFPCYWVSVPKELAMPYIEGIINEFYEDEVADWLKETGSSSSNTGSSLGNCNCNCVPATPVNIPNPNCKFI